MDHIRVAVYNRTGEATFAEIAEVAKDGMLTKFREEPGFRRYELAELDDGEAISISVWESQDAAERGVELAREWVAENLASKLKLVSNHVGDIAFSES